MNPSTLLVALLGLLAASLVHAHEPSMCTSMCSSEKQQCTSRAAKLAVFDRKPSLEETNPFARTADGLGQVSSEAARANERRAAQQRSSERAAACNASYKRCTSACAPADPPVTKQATSTN
ncbi:hypothetical protein [Massilia sp. 9I]|uniref:hypothetical protein n=1 Tax=Massilia sp. 9I TaxID=2653152 RepID=UPI0013576FFE|nr:hypothetical protein [Massilia sp. 9I]